MRRFFKRRRAHRLADGVENPKQIKIDYEKIDNFILRRYGLKDIKNKELFLFLNILFILCGVLTAAMFMYKMINIVNIIGAPITVILGTVIFRMVKKYGVKIEEKEKKEKEEKEK